MTVGVLFLQFLPPHPTLIEANFPSQKGKVFIIICGVSEQALKYKLFYIEPIV